MSFDLIFSKDYAADILWKEHLRDYHNCLNHLVISVSYVVSVTLPKIESDSFLMCGQI